MTKSHPEYGHIELRIICKIDISQSFIVRSQYQNKVLWVNTFQNLNYGTISKDTLWHCSTAFGRDSIVASIRKHGFLACRGVSKTNSLGVLKLRLVAGRKIRWFPRLWPAEPLWSFESLHKKIPGYAPAVSSSPLQQLMKCVVFSSQTPTKKLLFWSEVETGPSMEMQKSQHCECCMHAPYTQFRPLVRNWIRESPYAKWYLVCGVYVLTLWCIIG